MQGELIFDSLNDLLDLYDQDRLDPHRERYGYYPLANDQRNPDFISYQKVRELSTLRRIYRDKNLYNKG